MAPEWRHGVRSSVRSSVVGEGPRNSRRMGRLGGWRKPAGHRGISHGVREDPLPRLPLALALACALPLLPPCRALVALPRIAARRATLAAFSLHTASRALAKPRPAPRNGTGREKVYEDAHQRGLRAAC
eukprot:2870908-Rhodomonas_salina.2